MAPANTPANIELTVDVLMRKYGLLKQEVWLHIGFYKSHVARFQLMGAALFAVGAYIATHSELLPNHNSWWYWWVAASFIPVLANFLMFDIIESQYATILLADRMATIEEDINQTLGKRVLIWETFGSPRFWSVFKPLPGVFNPDWFLSAFGVIIAIANAVAIPCYIYWRLWSIAAASAPRRVAALLGVVFAISAVVVTFYSGARVLLATRGKPREYYRTLLREDEISQPAKH
jgi:hypothetical protein